METPITVTMHGHEFDGVISDAVNPYTAKAVLHVLPVEGRPKRWGHELYFGVPVDVPVELGVETVEVGDLAYWPKGNALCLFYGSTPASDSDQPKSVSPVNVIGHVDGVNALQDMENMSEIQISRR